MSHYSEPTEHRFATTSGELCYFSWGQTTDPTVLLIHATGFHARCWDRTIAALPAGLRIIAVDLPSHGRSTNTSTMSDWSTTAGAVRELVEGLDLRKVIGVGHSMGAHCLVQIAGTLTDRFDRLVLVDPVIREPAAYAHPTPLDELKPEEHMVARRRNEWPSPEAMFERFKDRHPYRLWQADILMDYCTYGLLKAEGTDQYELACPPICEASVYLGFSSTNPHPFVRKISVPVTVMRAHSEQSATPGAIDFALSPTWPGLADSFADGTDVHCNDLSHFMPMQDPERVAGYIASLPVKEAG